MNINQLAYSEHTYAGTREPSFINVNRYLEVSGVCIDIHVRFLLVVVAEILRSYYRSEVKGM